MTQEKTRNMDSFGSDEMSIPELKLVQNVGGTDAKAAKAQPGDFYMPLTGEVFKGNEGLKLVLVDMQKTRTYWGRSDISNDPPECSSADANSMQSTNGDDCNTCPHRCDTPWLVNATERREKCLVNYNMIFINHDTEIPILIRASGISTKAARELFTQLRLNPQVKGQYHKVIVRLTSEAQKTASGDAFRMKMKAESIITGEDKLKQMFEMTTQLLGTSIPVVEEIEVPEQKAIEAPKAEETEAPKETAAPKSKTPNMDF
jgi:hypothetical protein